MGAGHAGAQVLDGAHGSSAMNLEKPQRVLMAAAVLAVLALPFSTAWASTTGQLSGRVLDKDE